MNIFSFTGNLAKDCRTGNIPSGGAVCNFSVAATAGYGDKEQTLWIDCALWGKRSEGKLPQYLVKGQKVAISGELGQREGTGEYEGKTFLTCRVNSLDLIGEKKTSNTSNSTVNNSIAPAPQQELGDDFEDGIPF